MIQSCLFNILTANKHEMFMCKKHVESNRHTTDIKKWKGCGEVISRYINIALSIQTL